MILTLFGGEALSEFRQQGLVQKIAQVLGRCAGIRVNFVYFLHLQKPPNAQELKTIGALLGIDNPKAREQLFQSKRDCHELLVVPRVGTISPWSSKATDIFQLCGLQLVKRVERGNFWQLIGSELENLASSQQSLTEIVFDPMTQSILEHQPQINSLFAEADPVPLSMIDVLEGGPNALLDANHEHGFALNGAELDYLYKRYVRMHRNPTDAELMMFAQVNSEHCRHKIFNSSWKVDNQTMQHSLFAMIKQTHAANSVGTLSAYSDNAAVIEGDHISRLSAANEHGVYCCDDELQHFTVKVETHNHPVAISPYPGAATGSGGEIRDEAATGRGGRPRAGLVGFSVSHLRLPGMTHSWEMPEQRPRRIASPLQIMLEAPIGAAAFNNEFGRPCISGYFRVFESKTSKDKVRYGYHKPIMLAGGVGSIRPDHIEKQDIPPGSPIIVLGGPGMLIGLGGGSASSFATGYSSEELDWASVQRDNAEMQRRCQEVINACCDLGSENPILSIHDVGAGGLCNALPELLQGSQCGGVFELRNIANDESSMSPMQIWCNESQERYVVAIERSLLEQFAAFCRRERCPYAVVGEATAERQLVVTDSLFENDPNPIDLPMQFIFDFAPQGKRNAHTMNPPQSKLFECERPLEDLLDKVLNHPTVGDKTFLVTIGDRTVTGLVSRDQMVGPWQTPVADVGVVASSYYAKTGQAIGIGERTPIAIANAQASGRMAIGEAIANLAAANIGEIEKIRLSANWMVAAGEPGQDADLYKTVRTITQDVCMNLGVSIPVGKDSMSMRTLWQDSKGRENKVIAPLSLIVSGFSQVQDVGLTLTPELVDDGRRTQLLLIDLGDKKNRLGGSILEQISGGMDNETADLDDPAMLRNFFQFIQTILEKQLVLAYHDRSDGGMIATVCEMMFAARCGVSLTIQEPECTLPRYLFNEELGAVIQIEHDSLPEVRNWARSFGINELISEIGSINAEDRLNIYAQDRLLLSQPRTTCQQAWSSTSWQMQRLRDNSSCADQEYLRIADQHDPGLFCHLTFEHPAQPLATPRIHLGRPQIAILREQGVNGQMEMAAAFESVGFVPHDITMTDILEGVKLDEFQGIAACGGFSFGDVLGAGAGWGKSILYNQTLKETFASFFARADTFGLGVCNGCQMLSCIREIIPGAEYWPGFVRNTSEQYEARFVMTEIVSEKSILFAGMKGSKLPVPTSHGEGRVHYRNPADKTTLEKEDQICLKFVDNRGHATERYPLNPNGSPEGATGFTTANGRFTILMPHPERIFRTTSNSWHPRDWGEYSPWIRLFQNARDWVG